MTSITVTAERDPALFDALVAGVRRFNHERAGDGGSQPLSCLARDADGTLLGGVAGRTIYDHFLIEVVWVADSQRGHGLGRALMQAAEDEARRRGCVAAQVDTLSFQDAVFYPKLGFEVVGRVPDFPPGHERLFLLKRYRAAV